MINRFRWMGSDYQRGTFLHIFWMHLCLFNSCAGIMYECDRPMNSFLYIRSNLLCHVRFGDAITLLVSFVSLTLRVCAQRMNRMSVRICIWRRIRIFLWLTIYMYEWENKIVNKSSFILFHISSPRLISFVSPLLQHN